MTATFSPFQDYSAYTPADYAVWQKLTARQLTTLSDYACEEYNDCVKALHPVISPEQPPRFDELNEQLKAAYGWSIKVVPGFLPVDEFFGLLANKRFCSSTWLRTEKQLDYIEEPDMFHDIFGHIPLYLNADYASFAQKLGALGVKYHDDEEKITQLQRLYWFTIEFGVIRQHGELKVYGAGICSSYGEVLHVFNDSKVEVVPFDLDAVLQQDFIISEVQNKYFAINDFSELWAVVDELGARWS
ncbi:phenylalanine 4-monooxygenase [Neolewinella antarctica]|uniref:Phenylalanine-4-hydroxylase n=1 Tax=Neolewinella antarctica TaxID=442734 RepID=A0ABX0XDU9_9BACT|nr:phenylalanine 4-monooxygenase [Neolewinella antarctica]NJC27382.1 phenylalanine-4-hydroxylase [Neolewinella antarctica]